MRRRIEYTDEPLGDPRIVKDFLPSPADLAFRQEESVRVTLGLSKRSVEFFKREARKRQAHYQTMIRRLLDSYVDLHQNPE